LKAPEQTIEELLGLRLKNHFRAQPSQLAAGRCRNRIITVEPTRPTGIDVECQGGIPDGAVQIARVIAEQAEGDDVLAGPAEVELRKRPIGDRVDGSALERCLVLEIERALAVLLDLIQIAETAVRMSQGVVNVRSIRRQTPASRSASIASGLRPIFRSITPKFSTTSESFGAIDLSFVRIWSADG
jgi:hypothetical protein